MVLDTPKVWLLSCSSDTTGLSSFHTPRAGGGVTSDLLGGAQGKEACEGPGLRSSCAAWRLGLPLPSACHQRPPGINLITLQPTPGPVPASWNPGVWRPPGLPEAETDSGPKFHSTGKPQCPCGACGETEAQSFKVNCSTTQKCRF